MPRSPWKPMSYAVLACVLVLNACGGGDDARETVSDEASAGADESIAPATARPTVEEVTATSGPEEEASPTVAEDPFAGVSPIVEDFVATNDLNGAGLIVVDRDSGVRYEHYWGEFSAERTSLVASSSKMITAGVLLHLADEGTLDLDAPVADVTGWTEADPTITTAQLLSNSSGLVGLLDDPLYGAYICQFLAAGTLGDCGESILSTTADDADVVPPDTQFRYGGGQWQVAGAVGEAVSGQSWADLIEQIYVEPCELDALEYNNHFTQIGAGGFEYPHEFNGDPTVLAPTDNPNIEGGAYLTTGDYAKLLLMHLNDGKCGETQVLSTESLNRMHSDRIGEVYGGDAFSPASGYGMGWWIDRATGRLTDEGAYGTVPWLDLENGYGAYLVIEDTAQRGRALSALLYPVVEEAVLGS